MIEKIKSLITKVFDKIEPLFEGQNVIEKVESLTIRVLDKIVAFYRNYTMLSNLCLILALGTLAFFGYRLFKALLIVGGGAVGGTFAGIYLSPMIQPYLAAYIPKGIYLNAVIGLVAGLVFALVCWKLHKLVIFAAGAGTGYLFIGPIAANKLAAIVPSIADVATTPLGVIIISVICALISALILYIFFKLIFIVATSIGCPALAGIIIARSVFATPTSTDMLIAIALGVIVGLFALIYQFKTTSKKRSFRF